MPERTGDVVRRKVLVAACDGQDGRTLVDRVQGAGYKAVVCTAPEQVLEAAVSAHPDLIVIEFPCDELTRCRTLEQLGEDGRTKPIPVLLLRRKGQPVSAAATSDFDSICWPVGASEFGTRVRAMLRIAGITTGSPFSAGGEEALAERLRRSGRFDAVEVRKRYRSLTDQSQVAIIIFVTERPGVEKGGVMPGPMKRLRNAIMASPALEYTDGYGVTAGGRVLAVTAVDPGGELSRAIRQAYEAVRLIQFDEMHYRKDIGRTAAD